MNIRHPYFHVMKYASTIREKIWIKTSQSNILTINEVRILCTLECFRNIFSLKYSKVAYSPQLLSKM